MSRISKKFPVSSHSDVYKRQVNGDYKIAGCPGTGAKIVMDWSDAVGGCTGKLVPTGNAKDVLDVDGKKYTVSIIDAGNVVVFILSLIHI